MGITIEAEDVIEARRILRLPWPSISITFRKGYLGELMPGYIVDATIVKGEDVPKFFTNSKDALSYLNKIFGKHEEANVLRTLERIKP